MVPFLRFLRRFGRRSARYFTHFQKSVAEKNWIAIRRVSVCSLALLTGYFVMALFCVPANDSAGDLRGVYTPLHRAGGLHPPEKGRPLRAAGGGGLPCLHRPHHDVHHHYQCVPLSRQAGDILFSVLPADEAESEHKT